METTNAHFVGYGETKAQFVTSMGRTNWLFVDYGFTKINLVESMGSTKCPFVDHGSTKSGSWEDFGANPTNYNRLFTTALDFESCDDAFKWANRIAFENGFALVKANNGSKNRKEKGLRGSYFRCKRHGLPPPVDDHDKPRRSQKCSCPFYIRAVQNYVVRNDETTIVWNIVTSEGGGRHNHNEAVYKDGDRHFAGLDEEEKAYVRQQTMAGVQPRDIKNGLHMRTPEKPQPSSTQIYNETRKIRKEERGERNTATNMLALAVKADYVHWHRSDTETKQISHIFMAHRESVKMFRAYPYVVLMDATYNTNPYKNPVVEMVGVTPTGSSFLIACSMIPTESEDNYIWVLDKLFKILDCIGATPSVFVTDRELGLLKALEAVFPDCDNLLCRWHVNKAVNAKALELYGTDKLRAAIMADREGGWTYVIDSLTEESFQHAWGSFSRKWHLMATYIGRAWGEHAGKFVLCYTNEVFHLGNTATSRVESAHSLLKAWLKSSHLCLDTMWSRIHGLLEAQISKIKKELQDSMSRPRVTSRTFSILNGKVSVNAIEIMEKELQRGIGLGVGLAHRCGHVLRTTHGLPCACNLVSLHNRKRRVHLDDIHIFWRTLVYDIEQEMPKNNLDLFEEIVAGIRVGDPVYIRAVTDLLWDFKHPEDEDLLPPPINEHPKGRPRGSTSRNKSGFEHTARKFGTPSSNASTTVQQPQPTVGDFQPRISGAPSELNFTIAPISSWSKRYGIPEVFWGYFDGWVDVGDDGHCGYRVMSHAIRGSEVDYIVMREWCAKEISSDDIYKQLYGNDITSWSGNTGYESALIRVSFFNPIPCGPDHWLYCDEFLVFATLFNWTICIIGSMTADQGERYWQNYCHTIMPMKTTVANRQPYGIMWILLYGSHWMRLHSSTPLQSLPMPPLHPGWTTYRDPSVAYLDTLYQENIANWNAHMATIPRRPRRRQNGEPETIVVD